MLYPICNAVSSLFLVCVMPECSVMCSAVLCQSTSRKNLLFSVCFHAHKYAYFHFAFEEKKSEKNFHFPFVLISKEVQKLLIGWVDDNLNHLSMAVGLSINNHSSLAQEEQTAWVSLTNQCWSKLDDVTTFTTELLNVNPLHVTFLKQTDWISGSKVSKQLITSHF